MYLIFDTETTGLPRDWNAPITDSDNWPRMVQLAWQLHDTSGKLLDAKNYIVKPEGYTIPYNAEKIHGISTERAEQEGHDLTFVLEEFNKDLSRSKYNIGHNIGFDVNIVGAEYHRKDISSTIADLAVIDTKDTSTQFCAIPGGRGGKFKWPTLTELHTKLFGVPFDEAHDAAYDVDATAKCFFGLITKEVYVPEEIEDPSKVVYEAPKLAAANFVAQKKEQGKKLDIANVSGRNYGVSTETTDNVPFSHLHVHSQFSILQATSDVNAIVDAAVKLEMPAVALTDHGNMMAAFHFVRAALKAEIKPIVGNEFFVTKDRKDKTRQNNGNQIVVIAKNHDGYKNLAKLSSYAFTEGFYYVPRIDKDLLVEYKENLIVTTGGIWGEVPDLILNVGEQQAEEAFVWWKEQFGDDFYVELMRHGIEEEEIINETLLKFAKKYDVKYFASNNTYYTRQEESKAHDILLCVKDAESVNKPKKYIGRRGREFRYGFPNDEFYMKSQSEMKQLFADLPEAILTANEIVEKCESYVLESDVLLPAFEIPEEYQDERDKTDPKLKIGENNYLRGLTYKGAEERYDEITEDIRERLDFELDVISNTGYPGYFLIVQDFIQAARDMGVSVGPGRGSAAGSAVAYCTGITNIDPIKYDLLFERFLNPERISMPDIDIDFDDEGRGRVIQYVIDKYGANQVAQIITYGTMAAKSSIRDTARVLELPLSEADRVAKLVPDMKLAKLFKLDDRSLAEKLKNNAEDIQRANDLKAVSRGHDLAAQTVNQARVLEGSVRNTGIHACGVIITPEDITNYVPVALAKDSEMYCTQFDNSVVEDAGLLKMDFLGLKTLTLIKDACRNVKQRHDVDLDPEKFDLEDVKTYELFQRGETVGIFQYESAGMQKYMRDLKPTVFADLIAMNALYRPGPLEYIPSFIRRKHGEEKITYDCEGMDEYLAETYGITVYQEQVMLLSQKMADFTKGEADTLRKAMGKKLIAVLDKMKPKFIDRAAEKGHPRDKLEKVWGDWEAFASYAFNKSHSTCYAWVAYQTAFLKAHYPAEYMASVLSNNMNDIKQVSFFMEECQRMGLVVKGPDVNESQIKFSVNKDGEVRFGLGAIKGSGDAAVQEIISEREENGPYSDVFEFANRVNLRAVNKKTFEVLAQGGAFDCFPEYHRRQYIEADNGQPTLIELVIRYAAKKKADEESAQASLFGGDSSVAQPLPKAPEVEAYSDIQKLNLEKEVVGLFITGHPLDQYKLEIENFCTCTTAGADNEEYHNKDIKIAGMVTEFSERVTKRGAPFGLFTLEDYDGTLNLAFFGENYLKYRHLLAPGTFIFLRGNVEERYNSPGEWQFRPNQIELLEEIRDKMCKGITISMDISEIDDSVIHDVKTILNNNIGEQTLNMTITEQKEGVALEMYSKKFKIEASNRLLTELRGVSAIKKTRVNAK
ncbi:DNA polymerase III subunit alpha [Cyclobacteriaceae bacterium]|nr:DNA polymerase III subunit alpha [Cyclobacteriaceae bacterium]